MELARCSITILLYVWKFSRLIGVFYIFPIFVALFSVIFLREQLSLIKYGAIVLAVCGTFLVGMEKMGQQWKLAQMFWLIFFVGILFAAVDVMDKYLLQYLSFWQTYVLLTIPFSFTLFLPLLHKRTRKDIGQVSESIRIIFLNVCFSIAATFAFLIAAAAAPIAIVSAMGTLQPVFVFLLVLMLSMFIPHVLREVITPRIVKYKVFGIACVVTGVVILSF